QALAADNHVLRPAIAFMSTRDNNAEIYLIDPDGTNPRRLTNNASGEAFPVLSPDGKKIVFDSNRVAGADTTISDLFVMDVAEALDGALGGESHLVRGSSAPWSPDGK